MNGQVEQKAARLMKKETGLSTKKVTKELFLKERIERSTKM